MKIRRIAGCAAVVALIVGITLAADNIQSNFVPGDLGPAAAALGVTEQNGYYNLGAILSAAAARVEELEAALVTEKQEHEASLADLQVLITGTTAETASAVQALAVRIERLEAVPAKPLALVPGAPIQKGRRATLAFTTALGGQVEYSIMVIYLATGRLATDTELDMPPLAAGPGVIAWSWDCGTSRRGPALAIVTARTEDAIYRECFAFRVE